MKTLFSRGLRGGFEGQMKVISFCRYKSQRLHVNLVLLSQRWENKSGLAFLPFLGLYVLYISSTKLNEYIRPQGVENRASRPLSRT